MLLPWFSVVMVANLSCVGVEELPWEAAKRASEAIKAGRPLRPRKSKTKKKVHSSLSCQRRRYYSKGVLVWFGCRRVVGFLFQRSDFFVWTAKSHTHLPTFCEHRSLKNLDTRGKSFDLNYIFSNKKKVFNKKRLIILLYCSTKNTGGNIEITK